MVIFPASVIVFALGLSIGLVKRIDGKDLRSYGNRRNPTDENTLESGVLIVEQDFGGHSTDVIPEAFLNKAVEKRTESSPWVEVSGTLVHIPVVPYVNPSNVVQTFQTSSLMSMQNFFILEYVVNLFVQITPNTTEIPIDVVVPIIQIIESVAADIVSPFQAGIVESFLLLL